MHRREFLATTAVTLGGALGGCTSVLGPRETKIKSISFVNLSEAPQRIAIRVTRNGTRVYRRTFDLARKSDFGTEANPAPVIREPWMTTPARFTISARHANATQWYRKQFPVDDKRGPCYGVVVKIHPDGTITLPNDSHADGCS